MLIHIEPEKLIINTDHLIKANVMENGGISLQFVDGKTETIYVVSDQLWELLKKHAVALTAKPAA